MNAAVASLNVGAKLSFAPGCRDAPRLGRRGLVPTPEEALKELAEGPVPEEEGEWPRVFVGGPDKVRAGLEAMAAALGIGEMMVVTITHDHAVRRRSYELLAEAFGLRGR